MAALVAAQEHQFFNPLWDMSILSAIHLKRETCPAFSRSPFLLHRLFGGFRDLADPYGRAVVTDHNFKGNPFQVAASCGQL